MFCKPILALVIVVIWLWSVRGDDDVGPIVYPMKPPVVTNADIRDAILQIVNLARSTEDKLERHEYRERVLGEQLKKGIIAIDKRIKAWDSFKGMEGAINRIDERLAAVETILMQKDEKDKTQLQLTYEAVEDIQKNLPSVVEKLKNDISEKITNQKKFAGTSQNSEPPISQKDFNKFQNDVVQKLNKISDSINYMEKELQTVGINENVTRDINKVSKDNLDSINRNLDKSVDILEKYNQKLADYSKSPLPQPPAQIKEEPEWHNNFMQSLNNQKQNIQQVLSEVQSVAGKLNSVPTYTDFENISSNTQRLLQQMSSGGNNPNENNLSELDKKLSDLNENLRRNQEEISITFNKISNITENLTENFDKNYGQIKSEISSLSKVDEMMVQTADGVLDTKRRVEYGVHQILAEVAQLIKASTKDISKTISDRFDIFELSILDEDTGALTNLTTKIGADIDQVWRQIGIMHQQMTASADTLNKLQNQTDVYVNGSSTVMDSMKGKVGLINGKIVEVEDNLNYLLGRLSLVTQEFNLIKTGLGNALDQIKETFRTVQDKIKDEGPGPHKISNDIVPENISKKRETTN